MGTAGGAIVRGTLIYGAAQPIGPKENVLVFTGHFKTLFVQLNKLEITGVFNFGSMITGFSNLCVNNH